MQSSAELKTLLNRIDHRGYPAYKDTKGAYQFPSIDHVQGDPFASPSKVSVRVGGRTAGFPEELYREDYQRIALQDELTRQFGRRAEQFAFKAKGSGKSGLKERAHLGEPLRAGSAGADGLPDRFGERGCGAPHGDRIPGQRADHQCAGAGEDPL